MTFAADLYDAMAPLARGDEQEGWALRTYSEAMAEPFEWVVTYAYDDELPGWSLIMDPATCPPEGLPWLGQFVGVVVNESLAEQGQRQQIAAHLGFNRGTPEAIRLAVAATLTGERLVYLAERLDGNAYQLGIVTRTGETPDPALTLRAAQAVVPAGIVIRTGQVVGQSYAEAGEGVTYADWLATYATYGDLRNPA